MYQIKNIDNARECGLGQIVWYSLSLSHERERDVCLMGDLMPRRSLFLSLYIYVHGCTDSTLLLHCGLVVYNDA